MTVSGPSGSIRNTSSITVNDSGILLLDSTTSILTGRLGTGSPPLN